MTNQTQIADNFVKTAIEQAALGEALEMIKEWEQKQPSPLYADIAFIPKEIARIERETGADLSHMWGMVPGHLMREYRQNSNS